LPCGPILCWDTSSLFIHKKTCWIICDNLCLAITCRHSIDSLRSGSLDRHWRSAWICIPWMAQGSDQWAHLAGITSTTATMTWLGSLLSSSLVWTNQLGQKLRTSLLLCSALHILKLYQWRTIQLPCWMVHFDVASASILPGKRLPTDDEAEDELDGFCTGRNRTCQRRFDKITRVTNQRRDDPWETQFRTDWTQS